MGFSGLNLWTNGYTYQTLQDSKEITLDNVACRTGSWDSCSYITDHNCGHSEDVFLSCTGSSSDDSATEEPSGSFELVDSDGNSIQSGGTLGLLLYNDGTVCDDSFSDNSGTAICRNMGFTGLREWSAGLRFEDLQNSKEITMDNVKCSGERWDSCSYITDHNCGHSEDVFLSCRGSADGSATEEPPQLFSLVDSDGNSIQNGGTLGLLLYNDGTVCDDSFSDNSGTAICRNMGFTGLREWSAGLRFEDLQNSKEITMDNVECSGERWDSCSYITDHNCGHSEDVFLSCRGSADGSATEEPPQLFTLVDSDGNSIQNGGTLGLLLYNDGTVCDDSFSDNSGTAICRHMGFSGLREWSNGLRFEDLQNSKEITMDNVECSSGSWGSCNFVTEDNCGHSEDVFLSCEGSIIDSEVTEAPHTEAPRTECTVPACPEPETCPECPATPTCPPTITCPTVTCPERPTCPPERTCPECPPTPSCAEHPTCPECPGHPTCPPEITCPPQRTCPECPPTPTCPEHPTCPQCPPTPTCPEHPTCPTASTCPTPRCPAGSYPHESNCAACPANFFSSSAGSTSCLRCPGGSTSKPGSSQCDCPSGTMWSNGRCKRCLGNFAGVNGKCAHCPDGSQAIDGGQSCSCPDGQLWIWGHDLEGSCMPCPKGTFKAGDMMQCELCPTNSTSLPGSPICSCEAGNYWNGEDCETCNSGSASSDGASECTNCENGTSRDRTACVCGDGLVWEWAGSSNGSCKPCMLNTYKAGEMQSCDNCPSPSTSSAGSDSCKCSAGSFWNGNICQTCDAGSASADGANNCITCDIGSSTNKTDCLCEDGLIWEWDHPSSGSCKPCQPNSYRIGESQSCLTCPPPSTSSAGSSSCNCLAGNFWNGQSCQECSSGAASPDGASECTTCVIGSVMNKTECRCDDGMIWEWGNLNYGYCKPCVPNTFKAGKMKSCQSCPSSSNSSFGSSSCNCRAGSFWSGQSCQECPSGSASPDRAAECIACEIGSAANKTECLCEDGMIWEWDDLGNGSCKPCLPNTYKVGEMQSCQSCPSSTSQAGSSSCICLAGNFWNGQKCQECASGAASSDGASECTICVIDSSANKTECTCEDGLMWHWEGPSNGSCKPCPSNTYKIGEMQSCQNCPSPLTSSAGSDLCDCLAGNFWNGNSCQECPSGAASADGASECTSCVIDSSANKTECTCEDGMIWEWDGPSRGYCKPCLPNTYKVGEMQSCQSCPSSTSQAGSSSCICLAGNFWNGQKCQECASGTASTDGSSECTRCVIESTANKTGCLCEAGMTWEWDGPSSGSCKPCLRNTYKIGNMSRCEECPLYSLASPGSSQCICQKGTFRTQNDTCVMCSENTYFHETAGQCTSCPLGTVPINRHTACSCRAGNFWSNQKHECEVCPANHYSNDSAVECTKCPIYSVSEKGAKHCQTCLFGEHWKQYSCEKCNEPIEFGNGVFCVSSKLFKEGYAQEISQGKGFNMTAIVSIIAVILGVACVVLAVLLITKQKTDTKTPPNHAVRYSSVMTPNVEYSDWPGARPENAGPSQERPRQEDERSWCAEWDNFNTGSEENIYSYLDNDRGGNLREQQQDLI